MSIQMQADDFFNAYLVLKDNNEAMIERLSNSPGKPLIGTKELGTRPTTGVDIVCLAFSVELYIKDLHYAIKSETPRGHNILKLFVKPGQRAIVSNINKEARGSSLTNYI